MGKIRIENFFDPLPDLRQTFCAPLIKVETFLPPPPVWIEKLTAIMKQVCISGKVRY
jgi:hypothetical protein